MREGPKIRRACDEYERGSVRIFLTFLTVRRCGSFLCQDKNEQGVS